MRNNKESMAWDHCPMCFMEKTVVDSNEGWAACILCVRKVGIVVFVTAVAAGWLFSMKHYGMGLGLIFTLSLFSSLFQPAVLSSFGWGSNPSEITSKHQVDGAAVAYVGIAVSVLLQAHGI